MLNFRTILLFLAFLLLVIQEFVFFSNIQFGIIFRLIPTILLIIWFIISVFSPKKYTLNRASTSSPMLWSLRIFRPLASITIIVGAIFKILHWPYGNYFLIIGIGFLAFWSFLFSLVAHYKEAYNPDIIDDEELD